MQIKSFIAMTTLTAVSLSGCSGTSESSPSKIGPEISVSSLSEIGSEAINEFDDYYGCDVDTTARVEQIDIGPAPDYGNNTPSVIAGTAEPGLIILDPILKKIEEEVPGASRHTAIHEASHACTHEITYDNPYFIENTGVRMIGSVGLKANGIDSARSITGFALIEEGAAELLAQKISGIGSNNQEMVVLAGITKEILKTSGISAQKLQDYQESSDLIGFVADAVGIPREQVNGYVLQEIFNHYNSQVRARLLQ